MNILRLSTLSLTAAVAVFALGYNPSFADKPGSGCVGHCPHGDDDGQEVTYSVVIEGDIDGQSGDDWVGGFVGKKSIGLNNAGPAHLDVGEFTHLDFFTASASDNPPGPFGDDGETCFGSSSTIGQAIIKRGKGGRADAAFFFHGKTKVTDPTVGYVLQLFGLFVPEEEWPPVNDTHLILMTHWKMGVSNEGKDIKSISCIDEGADITVMISVTEPPI